MVVNNDAFYPKSVNVALNEQLSIDVVYFDFVSQLLCLLQNKRLMTKENLLLDINNPSEMYKSPNNILAEALSGSAYKEIYIKAHSNHIGNLPLLVIPICLWGDATHIDTAGRFKLEPWSFSPLIFKEEVRRNNKFWGILGYVKHLKNTSAQKKMYKLGDTMRMYHKQLSTILSSLKTSGQYLKYIPIPFKGNNNLQYFDITCPVLYIISDTEGADKICGRYGSHRIEVSRHCRMCNVDGENLDNEKCNFTYLKFSDMHQIALHGDKDERKKYSQHKVANAFHDVTFGVQDYGLLHSTPPDILHVVRKGIVEWSVKAVIDNLTDTTKAKLDALTKTFHNQHHQKHRKSFPKTNFPSGFTNLSNIRASEWVGILYLLVILSQSEDGWFTIQKALQKGGNGNVSDVLYIFEIIPPSSIVGIHNQK